MKIIAVVLTYNEEIHLERCLASLAGVADEIFVVDCFSHDRTIQIADFHGAKVLQRAWKSHSDQFNWALDQLPASSADDVWIMRIDADEFLTPELAKEIRRKLPDVPSSVAGIFVPRRMTFQGKLLRFGGIFPVQVLRIFRQGLGHCENRWMDEHVLVEGDTASFSGELIDDNKNTLTWWTEKHNKYSTREVVDILNMEYGFMASETVAKLAGGGRAGFKRWVKENIYWRFPLGLRAFVYFCYRYILMLGFLDGRAGAAFHVLQGFWYRYLVDAKTVEVKRYMKEHHVDVVVAIERVLGLRVGPGGS